MPVPTITPKTVSAPAPVVVRSDDAWPDVPTAATAHGRWQTIRHETVHVHLAVPTDAKVVKRRLPYGHPSVVIVGPKGSEVQITYSSGAGVFGHGLAQEPPTVAGLPIARIERSPENTTVAYSVNGVPRVVGWVRGAECKIESLVPEAIDFGFSTCASMRVPKPGPLLERTGAEPFSIAPAEATHVIGYVPLLYAGHFSAKRTRGVCSTEAEIRAFHGTHFQLERRRGEHGPLLVGRSFSEYDGVTFPSTTTVWATRAGRCCVATIAEALTPPTDAQLDYIARLCDGKGP